MWQQPQNYSHHNNYVLVFTQITLTVQFISNAYNFFPLWFSKFCDLMRPLCHFICVFTLEWRLFHIYSAANNLCALLVLPINLPPIIIYVSQLIRNFRESPEFWIYNGLLISRSTSKFIWIFSKSTPPVFRTPAFRCHDPRLHSGVARGGAMAPNPGKKSHCRERSTNNWLPDS